MTKESGLSSPDARDNVGMLYTETMLLYRAVGDREFYSIMNTMRFSCLAGGGGVKYFARSLDDALRFADKIINRYVVGVIEVEVLRHVVERTGDFLEVDPFLFKDGVVVIGETDMDIFNDAVVRITHKF